MNEIKFFRTSIVASVVVISIGTISSQCVAVANTPTSFRGWCERWQQHNNRHPQTKITISVLMNRLDTDDCKVATDRLQKIVGIYPLDTDKTKLGERDLAIDFSTPIDLETIVIAMPNLRHLELPNATPRTLAPLSQLTRLESLTLSTAKIKDITPLANLTNLTKLDLRGNRIEDLSPLIKLQKLKYLDVRNNRIRNFRVLSKLDSLFGISIQGNPIDSSTCLGKWADACEPDLGR